MKTGLQIHRIFVRWGLVKHPRGREYAKEHIGLLGGYIHPDEEDPEIDH